jgi:pyruvate formate lyase activating enzyme
MSPGARGTPSLAWTLPGRARVRRGLIFDIRRYSVHDGPGIRTTVFFKGCPLSCWWCHNPESQGRAPFIHYDSERCLRCGSCVEACAESALSMTPAGVVVDGSRCKVDGACVQACPSEARQLVGETWTVEELLVEIERDQIFHDQSGGGVTFSGGEPLLQWGFVLESLRACGRVGIHRTVDTTGFASPRVLMQVAEETDLFLYDLKTLDPALHRRATGVPLRPILENLERLLEGGARVHVRLPLIPGISDGDEHIERAGVLLAGRSDHSVEAVHLLPFHRAARDKHQRFGVPWRLKDDRPIPPERALALGERLRELGLNVIIGG